MEKICVAVRVRPSRNEETINGFQWKVESNRISLHRSHGTPLSGVSFAFDRVFDQECSNAEIYEHQIKDIIGAAVEGFNGTAFAYGQTSSGKTFTMNGSENDPGIIHRAVKEIFHKIEETSDREFLIRVSYMEIYNEDINDLFAVENQKLQIHESLVRGVFVAGLREEIVNSADQVLQLIQLGEANRHFGDTNMNARSSRSHTIFRMVIESKGKDNNSPNSSSPDDAIRVSVLNLVDLAGSERVAKTGAGGVRLKEGKHINKSLMILGNVINKLSEGGKQRGHIPYRDSKLTRILQPALGGNAKTSIICTVAPEEIHIEETKGTLQFASRAKRITNCVQVNEILTDAALLKRQTLEIEELRSKLQGSHAEVLEKEILKLRNDMLKYEMEREKLATELEEERRSQKERDQCIKEQQMKIDNLSNLVTMSDSDRSSSHNGVKEGHPDESTSSQSISREDGFSTPCFKTVPNVFVAKRSRYSSQPECSPLPDMFSDFADEDTWMKMNKGYIPDLDSLHTTPSRKVQSFPISEDCSMENYHQEMQNIQRQLELVIEERDEFKRKYTEKFSFSDQLTREIAELQQEILLIREVPAKLLQTVTNCKGIHNEVFSIIQNVIADEKSATAQILSTTTEVGTSVFSTLESHLMMAMDGKRPSSLNDYSIQEQCNRLHQKLSGAVASLVSTDASTLGDECEENSPYCSNIKGTLGGQIVCWKHTLENEVQEIKHKCNDLEQELEVKNQLLEVSEGKCQALENEVEDIKHKCIDSEKDLEVKNQLLEVFEGKCQALENEVEDIKHKWIDLEKELEVKNQFLEVSEGKCQALENEVEEIKQKCIGLEKDLEVKNQLLEVSEGKSQAFENEVEEIKQKCIDLEKDLEVKNQLLEVSEGKSQAFENEVEEIKQKCIDLEKGLEVKNQLLEVSEGKSQAFENEVAKIKHKCNDLENEVQEIKHKCNGLEKELEVKNQLLEVSEGKCHAFENEAEEIKHKCNDLENEVQEIKHKCDGLEKELEVKKQLLEVSKGKCHGLEKELRLLKEDRDAVLQRTSSSSQVLTQMTGEKERVLKDLNSEVRRRKKLEEEIKQFSVAFACRQRSVTSFHSEFKSILETMKAQNLTSLSKSHGS
ncbi:P-loop containing nucleoside triphosphate hydrolases superfamily protein [Perilla frutescens var. hirtella]|nr:P-loop containing nucleoside triphosphate hydrolases superfamily protein [Perilla frutescens var. hirtella]